MLALGVISASVFLGMLSRFVIELHFSDEGARVSYGYEHRQNTAADEKETPEEIENILYSDDLFSVYSEDDAEGELILTEKERSPGRATPTGSKNRKNDLDLSGYNVTPRKTGVNDVIPPNNAPESGVIRADKNKPVKDMYLREETQKSNITIPVESVDIEWIKRIWK